MASDAQELQDIFNCKRCGDCCRGYGGTYLDKKEIGAIAAFLNIDADQFVKKYCRLSGGRPLLAQGQNGYCIFWDGLCAIHPVKPHMCRSWPFIKSILIDVANWYIMADVCPGMRRDVAEHRILTCVRQVLARQDGRC